MPVQAHGDRKYQPSTLVGSAAEWDKLRVERRQIGSGPQNCVRPECNELVYILSGQAKVVRTGDGQTQEGIARPGTSWLVPAGTHETRLELDGSTECLIVFLPEKLIEGSALADYDINPDKAQLAYAAALSDVTLAQIGTALHELILREPQPIDRIFSDGLRMALSAHLVRNYTIDRWQPSARAPSLEAKRLRRVLDFMESHLMDDISLDDLAREACLSPYHFSRLFHEATGQPPHRYLTERRVQEAQKMLRSSSFSIAEIALDTGFGSQANFARTFRKVAGVTPSQYRELHRR
jgi:AraC family transcriptional regulator